jgi:hypothetical protein
VTVTGLAQFPSAAEESERDERIASTEQLVSPRAPVSREPRRLSWRTVAWFAWGIAGAVAIAWFIVVSPGEIGSKAEWFFGAVVFFVALVSMWQVAAIQRVVRREAAEAAERHRRELTASEERAMRELAMTQRMHRTQMESQQRMHDTQMESQQRMHDAEMDTQRELARIERGQLVSQLQKQAVIEVSRSVNSHTQLLSSLWNHGASILLIEDGDEREHAMRPIFEQISQVVNDFSIEVSNAHLLVDDDRLHRALDHVNEAALMAIRVAEDVYDAVVQGHEPGSNPIPDVQRLMQTRAAEARHLAWELLRAALDEGRARKE